MFRGPLLLAAVLLKFEFLSLVFSSHTPNGKAYFPKYQFYHNLSKLNECLYEFSAHNPEVVDVELRHRSRWGQAQYLVHLTNLSAYERGHRAGEKARILISAGEHGREFLPVETALYLIKNLTTGYKLPASSAVGNTTRYILNHVDLYIVVILNPDGRSLIENSGEFCSSTTVNGVDLNMELDKRLRHWDRGVSGVRRVLSEKECQVFQNLLSQGNLDAFLSLHSGTTQIFIPHRVLNIQSSAGYLPSRRDHLLVARKMSEAVNVKIPCVSINVTNTQDSVFNYLSGHKEVPFTFLIGLWGNPINTLKNHKHCFQIFNPPSEQLKDVIEATLPMFFPFLTHLIEWKQEEVKHKTRKLVVQASSVSMGTVSVVFFSCVAFWVVYKQARIPISWRFFYLRKRRVVSLKSLATAFS